MNNSSSDNKSVDEAVFDMRANRLAALANQMKTGNHSTQIKESLQCLQEGIDYLRLIIKYQSFDLEATRRENAELKAMFEEDNHPD